MKPFWDGLRGHIQGKGQPEEFWQERALLPLSPAGLGEVQPTKLL